MDSYQWTATMTCVGLLQLAIQQIVVGKSARTKSAAPYNSSRLTPSPFLSNPRPRVNGTIGFSL
jgi:hypothetical protein